MDVEAIVNVIRVRVRRMPSQSPDIIGTLTFHHTSFLVLATSPHVYRSLIYWQPLLSVVPQPRPQTWPQMQ